MVTHLRDAVRDGPPRVITLRVAGKFNRALQFDGVSNEATIEGFKGVAGTGPRTVSAWIKTSETSKSIGIVSWGDMPSGNKWSLLVQNTTDPKGTLRLETGLR